MKDKFDLAKGWLRKGDSDLSAARAVLASGGPYDHVCFHAQQAVEKFMKGFLAFHGKPFPFTHALEMLAPLCEDVEGSLRLSTPEIVALTDYAVTLRYDNDFWPSQETAADAFAVAEGVRTMILAALPKEAHP